MAEYNRRFRSYRAPNPTGDWIAPPGLAAGIELREHQRQAVAQILLEGRSLLAHVLGAGKTGVMATAAIEGKRLGLHNKAAIVVPNHLVEQVAAETVQWFPRARVLLLTAKETTKQGREYFDAKCAFGDWDAVVMSESLFSRIPVGAEAEQRFLAERPTWTRASTSLQPSKCYATPSGERQHPVAPPRRASFVIEWANSFG